MFQKWLIAFIADRGWRYLQHQRTRQKLQKKIEKRSKRVGKRVSLQRKQQQHGFKPGRALALMALGAGAVAFFRSKQQNTSGDADYKTSRNQLGSINVRNAASQPISAWAAPQAPTTAPISTEPTYREQATAEVPEHTTVPAISSTTDEPTYQAQASGNAWTSQDAATESSVATQPEGSGEQIDLSDTLAVPTTDHAEKTGSGEPNNEPNSSTIAVRSTTFDTDDHASGTTGEGSQR